MEKYHLILVEESRSAKIFKATDNQTGTFVTIKKILLSEKYGISYSSIREINILKSLDSPYIPKLSKIQVEKNNICLFMEYIPVPLLHLIKNKHVFSEIQFGSIFFQLVESIFYIHSRGIVHGDIRPENIFLNSEGRLKIANFGSSEKLVHTENASTLWYRSPELLLGSAKYDNKIDIWSLGCVCFEMKTHFPLFQGKNEFSQLRLILKSLGTPKNIYPWKNIIDISRYTRKDSWEKVFGDFTISLDPELTKNEFYSIFMQMFQLDPEFRTDMKAVRINPIVSKYSEKHIPIISSYK